MHCVKIRLASEMGLGANSPPVKSKRPDREEKKKTKSPIGGSGLAGGGGVGGGGTEPSRRVASWRRASAQRLYSCSADLPPSC